MATYTYETQLGHVLVQMMPFLKLYSEYCSRYDKCTAELKKIFSSVIATRWLENCLNNDACHNLNIYAFLIMPVQRIPRYKMLIDLLIKHTPPDHGDYENLLQAQKKIVDVAQWVDSYKSNNDMMAELSGKIVGMGVPLMQAGRKFIFQGQLSKKPSSGKSGATTVRWFFLFSDVLIYAQEKKKAFVYKGSINLFPAKFNLCVEDLPLTPTFFYFFFTAPKAHNDRLNNTTEKLSFQIVGKRKVLLVLIARTQQDKDNWMRELNNVLNTEDSPKSGGSTIRLKRG
ncbi:PH domain containing protein [Acanthamoeba castellanii str. Neff]|uniref:PH domain containing protein n=1 Tax=Acanthamoeba castellanii (strain ATCC 30010 / Neff) TaxID=1257118 RepID=L8H6P4_ACACF|nr:PH domain containing protein [Acanthamoeba castellanii str. Neff]ELR21174.1 PH domain containing protein [Acanthamoeba castellanii str. Neff]